MDGKKKYTKEDFDKFAAAVKRECEQTLLRQRERISELRKALAAAERKIAQYESQKELVYNAITAALKKADDIERVSLIKYNQEIAQLKSFHDKWVGYFDRIIAAYPLDGELVAASKVNGKIADVLAKAGDLDADFIAEQQRFREQIDREFGDFDDEEDLDDFDDEEYDDEEDLDDGDGDEEYDDGSENDGQGEAVASAARQQSDYSDRSPSGFSFAEALHPKDDLKDIMRELGIIIDEDE